MPRIGVTFDDVARAATKLLSTGDSPSVFKVREILGTGSNSTIAEHLKQWRQQRSEQRTVPLPDGICIGDLSHQLELCYQAIQRMDFFYR